MIVSWQPLLSRLSFGQRPTVSLTDKLKRRDQQSLHAKPCYQSAILTTIRKDLRDNPGMGGMKRDESRSGDVVEGIIDEL